MMCSPGSQERAQLHAKKKASGAEAQGASAKRGGEQRKFGVRHSCLGCSYEKCDSRERDFLNQGRCFFKLIIDRCTRCPVLGEFLRNICVWNHRGFIIVYLLSSAWVPTSPAVRKFLQTPVAAFSGCAWEKKEDRSHFGLSGPAEPCPLRSPFQT